MAIQKGQEMVIGIAGYEITGFYVRSVNIEPTGNLKYVPDEAGDDTGLIITNQGARYSIEADAKDGATFTLKKGDNITINGDSACVVEKADIKKGDGDNVTTLSLVAYSAPNALT